MFKYVILDYPIGCFLLKHPVMSIKLPSRTPFFFYHLPNQFNRLMKCFLNMIILSQIQALTFSY